MSMKLRTKISAALVAFGIIPSVIVAGVTFYTAWTLKRNQAFLITETARAGAHSIERMVRQTSAVKPAVGPGKPGDSPPALTGPARSANSQTATAFSEVSQQLGDYGIKRPQVLLVEGTSSASGAIWTVIDRQGDSLTELAQSDYKDFFKDAFKGGIVLRAQEVSEEADKVLVGYWPVETDDPLSDSKKQLVVVAVRLSEAYATIYSIQYATLIVLLLCLILTVTLGVLLGRQFVSPLRTIMDVTRQLQDGDLNVDIKVDSHDELGLLADQLNSVIHKLGQVVGEIRQATGSVSTASNELNSSAQQLSTGATEQAGTLQEIASSLHSVNNSVERNAQHAQQTAKTANQASSQAERGGSAVLETVEAMRQIAKKITVVEEIAYQTNLLALNAAIEAARAGVHGKGFAVVAGEVRKLAESSQTAAQQIGELASKSVKVAENAGQLLERIVPMIRETSGLVQEIAAASQEQRNAIQEINLGVSQLDEVVQQNAAASHELAATSGDLAGQAATLQRLVSFFRLEGGFESLALPTPYSAGGSPRSHFRSSARRFHSNVSRSSSSSGGSTSASGDSDWGTPSKSGGGSQPGNAAGSAGIVVNLDDDSDFERF
ncbi:MAG: methyl-accepting chemotaxis protein [bacterium]